MLNLTTIVGRLTHDPELTHSGSNVAICRLTVATNETYMDSNGVRQEDTQFHTIITFNKVAEACAKFLKKGRLVIVTGRLTYRSFDDDRFNDGEGNPCRRKIARIIAQQVKFGPRSAPSVTDEDVDEAVTALDATETDSTDELPTDESATT